jgi:hypothetical protein
MMVDNFYVNRSQGLFGPFETHPPLVVDADAVLAFAVSGKRFKTIAGQRGNILQRKRDLKTVELEACGAFDSEERLDLSAGSEIPGPLVSIS